MMNYGVHYKAHDDTFHEFAEKLNKIANQYNIYMLFNKKETYGNDGAIAYADEVKIIGIDWELRQKYYPSYGEFPFARYGLSQYGAKKGKGDKIALSLQMSTDQTGLLLAWHEDFELKNQVKLSSNTKTNREEEVWRTFHYVEFDLRKEESFIEIVEILRRAGETGQFNHKSFAA